MVSGSAERFDIAHRHEPVEGLTVEAHVELLRLAIIGAGFGAQVHLPAFLSIPVVRVVGLADSGSGRARRVAETIGQGVGAWDAWQEAVEAPDVDALSVATPPYVQAEIVHAALAAGKHVLCEKPFGLNGKEAARMWEQAQAAGLANALGFEFRMEPGIAEVQRLVASGEIGAVRRVRVTWLTRSGVDPAIRWSWRHHVQLGGGVLNAFASHVVDYVEWICNRRIHRVSASCQIIVKERTDSLGRKRAVTAEDHCELACDMEDGAIVEVTVSNCSSSEVGHRIEVDGERGRLVYLHKPPFAPDGATLRIETDARGPRMVSLDPLPPVVGYLDTRIAPFRELARRFVRAASGAPVDDLPDFASGVRVQRVLDAARESSRLGKTIAVVEETKAACQ
jgi:predicted dehydrogenase